jgi:hypothetical protein
MPLFDVLAPGVRLDRAKEHVATKAAGESRQAIVTGILVLRGLSRITNLKLAAFN